MKMSTGRRPMASLRSSLACPPAEDLHTSQGDISNNAHRRAKQRRKAWYFGTWNVRSLVDSEGTVETAKLSSEKNESEYRRIDLVIRELNRYDIKVAALQETKWFGNHVYHVGKTIVLTAGRETPQGCQPKQRGEGVAIVLTGHAVTAWKAGGEQWKSWGSRIIKATLGGDNKKTSRVHILSCYAPTFAASRTAKDNFFDDLQQAMGEIPPNEPYVMLGDFNARVGSSRPNVVEEEDQWENIRGPHGFGEVNDAGKELLHILSLNEATVCNTWFQKKDIYKGTWQHPKSKKWHCIDYAIVRTRDKRRCLDASVNRGAECNTDHQLLRIKMRLSKLQLGQPLTHTDMTYPNWLAQVLTRMERIHPRAGSKSWLASLPKSNGK